MISFMLSVWEALRLPVSGIQLTEAQPGCCNTVTGITGGFVSGLSTVWIRTAGYVQREYATGGSLPMIATTTNMGSTWTAVNTGTSITGYANIKWVSGTSIVYLTGSAGPNGCAAISSSGGVYWSVESTAGATSITNMDAIFFAFGFDAFAMTASGTCIKVSDNFIGVNPVHRNYPCLMNFSKIILIRLIRATTIKYSLPKASQVTLKIYDALGNEVKTVADKFELAGNYVESFDGSELASGVYFYKLNAGDYTETKKMSLVK